VTAFLGVVDKGYSQFNRSKCDEAKVRFLGFVVSGGNPPPVLELAEQALDEVTPGVVLAIMRDRYTAIALGGDDRFNTGCGKLWADGNCVNTLVGEPHVNAFIEHTEQWTEAFHIVRLVRRQDEAKRSPVSIAGNGAIPCSTCHSHPAAGITVPPHRAIHVMPSR